MTNAHALLAGTETAFTVSDKSTQAGDNLNAFSNSKHLLGSEVSLLTRQAVGRGFTGDI